jgi:PST family polysaccharide transporter
MSTPSARMGLLCSYLMQSSTVVKNVFSLASLDVANYILPLLTFPYLLRVLGAEQYGIIAFVTSFVQYFWIVTDYGFTISAGREIAIIRSDSRRVSEVSAAILFIRVCLMLTSFGVMAVCVFANIRLRSYWRIEMVAFGIVVANAFSLNWFYQGMERMRYITVLGLLSKGVYSVSIFAFIHRPDQYVLIPMFSSISEIIASVGGLIIAYRHFGLRLRRPHRSDVIGHLGLGFHTFISYIASSSFSATRTFALGLFTSSTLTGYYAIAERLCSIVQSFPLYAVISATYPRLCALFAKDPRNSYRIVQLIQRSATIAYCLTLPLVFVAAPLLVRLVSGHSYPEAVFAFRLLLISVLFSTIHIVKLRFLLVAGRFASYSRICVSTGIVGSLLSLLLGSLLNIAGPPIAAALMSVVSLFWTLHEVRRIWMSPAGACPADTLLERA